MYTVPALYQLSDGNDAHATESKFEVFSGWNTFQPRARDAIYRNDCLAEARGIIGGGGGLSE